MSKESIASQRMRILVAEDDAVSLRILSRDLEKWNFEVFSVNNGLDALEVLTGPTSTIELAILDWMMPGLDGPAVCKRLRAADSNRYVYVILLSGKDTKEDVVQGLNAGADDYLPKPYNGQELLSRIRAAERIIRLQSELRDANDKLRLLAETDSLTQMFNRHAIMDRLHEELSRSWRNETSIGIAMADIDRFKSVNDTHGHAAGDAVLRSFATLMEKNRRSYDSVGRYGGEEFLLIFPDMPKASFGPILERLRQAIADNPIRIGSEELFVTASFGGCWVGPGVARTHQGVLHLADKLLYDAKEGGRNRVVTEDYQPEEGLNMPGPVVRETP